MAPMIPSAFSTCSRERERHRSETEAWAAIHSALDRVVATLTAGHTTPPSAATGRAARPQLVGLRFLFARQAERYVAGARTRAGRAWRRRQVARSSFAKALAEAETYLTLLGQDQEGPHFLPELLKPRSGPLPVRERRAPGRHRAATAV
ncbi:hypothetical protein [Streptomyces sp. MMBL 11-1]|uniref:hypothetical protein n=1 Tax=Streptomyces sp. MMBL 11-1 TaxID=3026420 RepID=UPI002361B62A|nr:hypothetical protein [Streptomyces sp. MMBL 11-1]